MKRIALLTALMLAASIVLAQNGTQPVTPVPVTPLQNLYAVGGAYNFNAQPSVAGTALYAHYVASPGTYAFTVIDVLPNTVKPFFVTSNVGVGLAQRMFSIGRVSLFMPTAAGVSWSGSNTGWQWTGGTAVTVSLNHSFYLVPTVRFLKSSVSGGSGYQPVLGLGFGWGK
jgi:hypothetical protein